MRATIALAIALSDDPLELCRHCRYMRGDNAGPVLLWRCGHPNAKSGEQGYQFLCETERIDHRNDKGYCDIECGSRGRNFQERTERKP